MWCASWAGSVPQRSISSPGSSWENGYIESFNARLRDELLNGEIFYSLADPSPDPAGVRCTHQLTMCPDQSLLIVHARGGAMMLGAETSDRG